VSSEGAGFSGGGASWVALEGGATSGGSLGAGSTSAATLLSYLLFERGYTRELIALGLADARARAEEIRAFLAESQVKASAASRAE